MALSGGVRVEGVNQLVRDLTELGVDVEDIKGAFARLASMAASTASSFAPHRTGALAASVRGNRAKNKAVVAAGAARVPYAGAINYGWPARGIAASSFMQRADDVWQDRAVPVIEDELNRIIREKGLA